MWHAICDVRRKYLAALAQNQELTFNSSDNLVSFDSICPS